MKAIALISGGLDGILAARVIKDQGIGIVPVKFVTPFAHLKVRSYDGQGLEEFIYLTLGERLIFSDIGDEFLKMILSPGFGFGKHMNPCIDCKILMLKEAVRVMRRHKAQFVVTGEVLGQRPMSQHRRALNDIEKESGLSGLLLRPLSAKLLSPTLPEESKWVDRARLFDFSGRSRLNQLKLSRRLKISGLPNASGGCLLTDRKFSARLRDLMGHNNLDKKNIGLLKIGRHFRINNRLKLIVGRNEEENKVLEKSVHESSFLFYPDEKTAGPTALACGDLFPPEALLCAEIVCSYCDVREGRAEIFYRETGKKNTLSVFACPGERDRFRKFLI